jgi:membrane fusion protein (multidrug efflux system)
MSVSPTSPSAPRFAHRTLVLAAAAALGLSLTLSACGDRAQAQPPSTAQAPRATPVGVVVMAPEHLDITTELSGRTTSPLVAEIRPQVGGLIQRRTFTEGAHVKAGEVLYQIDAASYQASVDSAQAALARAQATLAASQLTAQRQAALLRIQATPQQTYEDAEAAVAQAKADVASAQATLATARINLARTRITSPISGLVDVSSVTPGALVTAEQTTALTTVRQINPIQVDITQSSAELLRLKAELAQGQLHQVSEDEVAVKLILEDGSTYPQEARLRFAGVSVNTSTGAITLRAVVPNPNGLLLPGMYVRAVLATAKAPSALLVPQQAVSRDRNGGASVLVVDAQHKAAQRAIVTSRQVGNRWLVTSGLQAGDQVIVEGNVKVKAGDVVQAQAVSAAPGAAKVAEAAASATAQ